MKALYFVKELTDEGHLKDVPEYGPHYDPSDPFPRGYESMVAAETAISWYFASNTYANDRLVIVKIYQR